MAWGELSLESCGAYVVTDALRGVCILGANVQDLSNAFPLSRFVHKRPSIFHPKPQPPFTFSIQHHDMPDRYRSSSADSFPYHTPLWMLYAARLSTARSKDGRR